MCRRSFYWNERWTQWSCHIFFRLERKRRHSGSRNLWHAIITSVQKYGDFLTMSKDTLSACKEDHTFIPVYSHFLFFNYYMDLLCGLIEKEEMWARILIFNYEWIIYMAFIFASQRVGFRKTEVLYLRIREDTEPLFSLYTNMKLN